MSRKKFILMLKEFSFPTCFAMGENPSKGRNSEE
jgi:hypothetical protein